MKEKIFINNIYMEMLNFKKLFLKMMLNNNKNKKILQGKILYLK